MKSRNTILLITHGLHLINPYGSFLDSNILSPSGEGALALQHSHDVLQEDCGRSTPSCLRGNLSEDLSEECHVRLSFILP